MRARVSFEIEVEHPDDCASLQWELGAGYINFLDQYTPSIVNARVELIPEEGS